MRQELETTSRIKREELLGLLNTMTPMSEQRITAEMVAVVEPPLEEQPRPAPQPESQRTTAEIVVRFTSSTPSFHPPPKVFEEEVVIADPESDRPSAQMLVVAASFMVTLIAGTFAILLS